MTDQEILIMMARILGGNIDTGVGADYFIDTGPIGDRTVLLGDERIVTRRINALGELLDLIDSGVRGFDTRFSTVVGNEAGADEAEFIEIDDNLIQAIVKLKRIIDKGGQGLPPGGKTYQLLRKNSDTDGDASWNTAHVLMDQFPTPDVEAALPKGTRVVVERDATVFDGLSLLSTRTFRTGGLPYQYWIDIPGVTSYQQINGAKIFVQFHGTNIEDNVTLNINSLGDIPIRKNYTDRPIYGQLGTDSIHMLQYDISNNAFFLIGEGGLTGYTSGNSFQKVWREYEAKYVKATITVDGVPKQVGLYSIMGEEFRPIIEYNIKNNYHPFRGIAVKVAIPDADPEETPYVAVRFEDHPVGNPGDLPVLQGPSGDVISIGDYIATFDISSSEAAPEISLSMEASEIFRMRTEFIPGKVYDLSFSNRFQCFQTQITPTIKEPPQDGWDHTRGVAEYWNRLYVRAGLYWHNVASPELYLTCVALTPHFSCVAIGSDGLGMYPNKIYRTYDFVHWQKLTLPSTLNGEWNDLIFANWQLIAIANAGNYKMMRSYDAENWEPITTIPADVSLRSITYGDTENVDEPRIMVAVGHGGAIIYSIDDGDTWTKATSPTTKLLLKVAHNKIPGDMSLRTDTRSGGIFIAVAIDGDSIYSEDGKVWYNAPAVPFAARGLCYFRKIEKFVAVGQGNRVALISSDEAKNPIGKWEISASLSGDWIGVEANRSSIVAIDATGKIMFSHNAESGSWILRSNPNPTMPLNALATYIVDGWFGRYDMFVAVGKGNETGSVIASFLEQSPELGGGGTITKTQNPSAKLL